jgi:hypothetical protein
MYLKNNVHLINMWKFYVLGVFYRVTVNIKVVDNNSNYNSSEIIYF